MNHNWLLMDCGGVTLTAEEKEIIQHPSVAGVILFSRNYESPSQLSALTSSLRKLKDPLIIAVDQEGGRVQRFQEGFTKLPPLQYFGKLYQENPSQAKQQLAAMTKTMVTELQALGVNLSLAPVLDIDYGYNEVIADRSLHRDTEIIIELGDVILDTMHALNMLTTGKHFPGHGGVTDDSHDTLPIDPRDQQSLLASDIQPFAKLLHKLDALMPAHILYQACDTKPAGFSRFWLQDILRDRLGFSGVIMSDDLTMQGAAAMGSYEDRARMALEAGCDLLLVCNNQAGAVAIIDAIKNHRESESQYRIQRYLRHF